MVVMELKPHFFFFLLEWILSHKISPQAFSKENICIEKPVCIEDEEGYSFHFPVGDLIS